MENFGNKNKMNLVEIATEMVNLVEKNKQLEEQNDKLIKERDMIQKELETSVEYWKNEVFKKMEVKLTGVTKEKIQEIRKRVCDEIRRKMTVYRYVEVRTKNGYEWALTDSNINEILDQIEKG